jgi:hypothetical protein
MLASNLLCGVLDLYLRFHQWVNGSCLAECVVCSTDVRFTSSIHLLWGYHLHSCLCFGTGIAEGCPPAPSGINDLSPCWLSSLGVLVLLLPKTCLASYSFDLMNAIPETHRVHYILYLFFLIQIDIKSACFPMGTLTASVISADHHDIFVGKFGSNVLSFW